MIKALIENITVTYTAGAESAELGKTACELACKKAKKLLNCKCTSVGIHKKSIDARRRHEIKLVYSVVILADTDEARALRASGGRIKLYSEPDFSCSFGNEPLDDRPVIIGFGPAGIFCALALAGEGYRPVVYERGAPVDERVEAVEEFYKTEKLNASTNIQFGAGGAGTFSDGKLTTRVNDPLCAYVSKKLVELGAPEDIAWRSKPHIGTDVLRAVVKNADAQIRSLGGEIHYYSQVKFSGDAIFVNGEKIPYGVCVAAIGHSARDTYAELMESGYAVEPKPYSVGVRIEHLQHELDCAMFGDFAGDSSLGHAEYSLSHRRGDRGAYSFCMCPGGEVVAAASEECGVVTNGMSRRARDGVNANAAIAVSVHPEDYGGTPTGAVEFQRNLERRAFSTGGGTYAAPVQSFGDFCDGKVGDIPTRISPTYMNGNVVASDLNQILPPFVSSMLKEGIHKFGSRIKGFNASDVPLTGVETRTSAPVRIMRHDDMTAFSHPKIYPCGEGAGYAGGIMSAALDGLRVAGAIMSKYSKN